MKLHLFFVVALTGLSLALASACSDKFVDCEQGQACLASGGANTTGDGDGDTSSGGTGGDGRTSSGGAAGDGDGDTTSGSGGTIVDPCDACEGETPVCVDDECVACSDQRPGICQVNEHCSEENECVECLGNTHCTEADASSCDLDTNSCTGCSENEGCEHLTDTLICDTDNSVCVECTVQDESACGPNSCNPATNTCTTTPRTSVDVCEVCLADSECKADHRCVPMEFDGSFREGGFCLRTVGSGPCAENPYRSLSPSRVSLSGHEPAVYCTINETLTTCEAVLDLDNDKGCIVASDCGAPGHNDGLCETVTSVPNKCTYACTSPAQCRTDDPGSTCAGSSTSTGSKYCGG